MLQLHHFLAHLEQRASFLQDHLHLIDEMFQYAGSILMETMLCECLSLVDKQMLQLDWSEYPHSFLVYMKGGLKVHSCLAHILEHTDSPCPRVLCDNALTAVQLWLQVSQLVLLSAISIMTSCCVL